MANDVFAGSLGGTHKDFHVYMTDNEAMMMLGLSTYTYNTLEDYFKNNIPSLKEYFGETSFDDVKKSLLGEGSNDQPLSILAFEKSLRRYVLKSGSTIYSPVATGIVDLCKKYDAEQLKGKTTDVDPTLALVNDIKTSASGCVTFVPKIKIYDNELKPLVKIFFQRYNRNDNGRSISQLGEPVITTFPRSSTGRVSGFSTTHGAGSSIGTYGSVMDGGINNPKNTVAAPINLIYNDGIGKFESGTTQILARLLTNIDNPQLPNLPNLNEVADGLSYNDMFDKDSFNNMAPFTEGYALPLSSDKGNPYLFGPNVLCKTSNKKERIKVTNRAPRTFKAGDVVMCSHIGTEWIIQGFDVPTETKMVGALKVGDWSFSKFIVNSDIFEKVNFAYSNNVEPIYMPMSYNVYENQVRKKYYQHLTGLAGGNGVPEMKWSIFLNPINNKNYERTNDTAFWTNNIIGPDIVQLCYFNFNIDSDTVTAENLKFTNATPFSVPDYLNSGVYLHTSTFDQLGKHMGGTNQLGTLLKRTNPYTSPDGRVENTDYTESLGGFWGVVFTDGYTARSVTDFKARQINGTIQIYNPDAGYFSGAGLPASDITSASIEKNLQSDSSNFIFSNKFDTNFVQLPADVGLNSKSSPIENYNKLFSDMAERKNPNYVNALQNYMLSSGTRYSWLYSNNNAFQPMYGLTPTKPNSIAFIPLAAEVATFYDSAYRFSSEDITTIYNPIYKQNLKNTGNLFGNMLNRMQQSISFYTQRILYGPYVKVWGSAPAGGPSIFPDVAGSERSNLIGIIAAKNKFTLSAGSSLVLKTKQRIGQPLYLSSSAVQSTFDAIYSSFSALFAGSSSGGGTRSKIQWGSEQDSYNSWGTTALHVRIFDQWPDNQTIYDPRFFAVFHFNPLSLWSDVEEDIIDEGVTVDPSWKEADGLPAKYLRGVRRISCSVDFRIPTLATLNGKLLTGGAILQRGSIITKGGVFSSDEKTFLGLLRPVSEWMINPIRRGQLLTGGGFKYWHDTIVANKIVIEDGGSEIKVGQKFALIHGCEVTVKEVDIKGAVTKIEITESGFGFIPEDFLQSFVFSNYGGLKLALINGKVEAKLKQDFGPVERTESIQRLTKGSNGGRDGVQTGEQITTISIEANSTGQYDAFYFFHNDVIDTYATNQTTTDPFLHYVNLEISAG